MTESELIGVVEDAARDGSWNAAAWLVERRWPERWMKPGTRPLPAPEKPEETPDDPIGGVIELARRRPRGSA
jgi:hypothetical protein